MASYPDPIVIGIVGLAANDRDRHCEEHEVCGAVVHEDVVVRLRKVQVLVDGKEETAIAAYWITDGMERCRIGFLQRHMVMHASRYDGALAQVTSVLGGDNSYDKGERKLFHHNKGFCYATIISALPVVERVKMKVEKVEKGEKGEEISDDSNETKGKKRACGVITLE
jgi:hypothetical protein